MEGGPNIDPLPSPSNKQPDLALFGQFLCTFSFLFHFPHISIPLFCSYTFRFFSILRLYPCPTQLWASQRRLRPEIIASDTAGSANMAALGVGGFAPVLAALSTMQSNVERSQKSQAHEYLERFQKSVCRTDTNFYPHVNHTDINVARSLVIDTLDPIHYRRHGRSEAVCCDHVEGKGKRLILEFVGICMTSHTGYVRLRSASPTIPSSSAKLDS